MYEIFEPDPNDEYYDQMCQVAYSNMFNSGRNYDAENNYEYRIPAEWNPANS